MPSKPAIVAAITGAALALSTATISFWEGKKNDPYKDVGGVMTVCYGETRVPMKHYTDAQCLEMLTKATKDFQDRVLKCVPQLEGRPTQLAAATSLAYNIGSGAFCSSTAARKFKAEDYKGGCEALKMWNKVKGKTVQGLVNRRQDEYNLCMTYL